jgi:hypothetical protein
MSGNDDMRQHLVLYGIHYNDWSITFGTFSNVNKILDEQYISDGATTTETSVASDTNMFIFPFHVKKKFFIEGTIKGHITVASTTATSTVTSYRVSLCSINEDTTDLELFSTGWVTVNDTLAWDAAYSVGEEKVYTFWIDAWEYAILSDKDRIYLKVQVNCDQYAVLWHSNDSTYNDIYVDIPLRLE